MAWEQFATLNATGQRVDAPGWATATFYRFGSLVFYNTKHYSCLVAHTSGTFADDLADNKWFEVNIFDSIYVEFSVNPFYLDGIRFVKNGVEQARDVNFIFLEIRNDFANTKTTGFVGTRQALALGDACFFYQDKAFFNYIDTNIPALDGRVLTLEQKLTGLSGLQIVKNEIDGVKNSVVSLQGEDAALQVQITPLQAKDVELEGRVAILEGKMTAVESGLAALQKFAGIEGSVLINNEQLVALELPELAIDGTVHSSVRLDYEIQRYTGTEYRSSTGTLHFCLKQNGVWMTDRNVVSFDVDGITFTINTILDKQGKVYYTTDLVNGAGYVGVLKFRRYVFGV